MKELVIGVLGGMGTYATINLFKQYAEVFPAEKEWDRPRIIIDNRCTMPSRVRAFLYHENVEKLVNEMSDSIEGLLKIGGGQQESSLHAIPRISFSPKSMRESRRQETPSQTLSTPV